MYRGNAIQCTIIQMEIFIRCNVEITTLILKKRSIIQYIDIFFLCVRTIDVIILSPFDLLP